MGTRTNILFDAAARSAFLDACAGLSTELSNVTASQAYGVVRNAVPSFRMRGIDQRLSFYDLFVIWHAASMEFALSVGNAAHGGPIFLPWHRTYMIALEQWMQTVLDDADFGLPYWDWAADGELPAAQQYRTELWSADFLGEARGQVTSGRLGEMMVHLQATRVPTPTGIQSFVESATARRIRRNAGVDISSLPTRANVAASLDQAPYDVAPFSDAATRGHRNLLEGWAPQASAPHNHNRVHVWVGGDMSPSTSPNDPVFFLNHCNVDRIWEAWMAQRGRSYVPAAGQPPAGHALDSVMFTLLGEVRTPQQVLDPSPWYEYDSLAV